MSSRWTSPARRACSMASNDTGSRSARRSRRHRARRRAYSAEAINPGSLVRPAIARASSLSRSWRSNCAALDEHRDEHAAQPHLVLDLVGGEGGDRLVEDDDQLGVGRLADGEPDAGDRQHPGLGGPGAQDRVTARVGDRRGAPGCGLGALAVAEHPARRAVEHLEGRDLGGAVAGDEGAAALDPAGGLLVGDEPQRLLAGSERGGEALVARHEVPGCEDVVGELGGGDLRARRLPQRPGDAAVEVLAARRAEAAEHGVADQRVRRDEATGTVLAQQPGADRERRRRRGPRRRRARSPATSTGNVDCRPATAARATHVGGGHRQAVEPRREHRADRVRHLGAAPVGPMPLAITSLTKNALPPVIDAQLGGSRAGRSASSRRSPTASSSSAPTSTLRQLAVPGEAHEQPVELRVRVLGRHALRAEHHHAARALVAQHVLEQLDRRRVGPLDVVDHEQDRGDPGLDREQVGDGLEQQVALDLGRRALGAHASARAAGAPAAARSSRRARRSRARALAATARAAPCAGPARAARTGRSPPGRPGPRARWHRSALDVGGEVGGERGLAGPGLADDDGEPRRAARGPRPTRRRGRRSGRRDRPAAAAPAATPRRAAAGRHRRRAAAVDGGAASAAGGGRDRGRSGERRVVIEDAQLQRLAGPGSGRARARRRGPPACERTPAARRPGDRSGTARASAGGRAPRAAGARRSPARARSPPRRRGRGPGGRRSAARWRRGAARPSGRSPSRAHSSSATSARHGPRHSPSAASRRSRAPAGSVATSGVAAATASSKRCTSSDPRGTSST